MNESFSKKYQNPIFVSTSFIDVSMVQNPFVFLRKDGTTQKKLFQNGIKTFRKLYVFDFFCYDFTRFYGDFTKFRKISVIFFFF